MHIPGTPVPGTMYKYCITLLIPGTGELQYYRTIVHQDGALQTARLRQSKMDDTWVWCRGASYGSCDTEYWLAYVSLMNSNL